MTRFRTLDAQLCFRDGERFLRRPLPGGGMAYLRAECECPALRIALTRPEAIFENASKILKDSRSSKAALSELSELGEVFIKRHNNKGLRYTLRHLFRKARAFRCWQSAWLLEQLGIPTPRPIASIAFKKALILQSSYLITEAWTGLIPAPETVNALLTSEKMRDNFLREICTHLSLMHDCGITHGDLKLSNLAVIRRQDDGTPAFAGFMDLDSMKRRHTSIDVAGRAIELARLTASFIAIASASSEGPDHASLCHAMANCYEETGGPTIPPARILEAANSWLDKA